jgi:hypothetical protein
VAAASAGHLHCFECLQDQGQFLSLDSASVQAKLVYDFPTDV